MNIQDTLNQNGLELDSLPKILKQRVLTIRTVQEKLDVAELEHEQLPTEESQAKLKEIQDYFDEYVSDVNEQLENHKAKMVRLEEKAEKERKTAESVADEGKTDDKKSSGWGGLIIGGILLVATLGAVNIMRNK